MNKLLDIIYYVMFLIKQAMKRKQQEDTQKRREKIQESPSEAFKEKFTREDGAPVDYEEKDQ